MADEQFRGIHLTVEDIARLTELARPLPPKSGSQPRREFGLLACSQPGGEAARPAPETELPRRPPGEAGCQFGLLQCGG